MNKNIWVNIIAYAFIILFLYTAFSKVMVYERSLSDLQRSPFIDALAVPLSILLPLLEIGIAVLLFVPKYRYWGMIGSAGLMLLFTIYVSVMVFTLKSLPCSCGGLIRELTWKQHFFFNIFFTLLAFIGVWLSKRGEAGNSDNKLIYT